MKCITCGKNEAVNDFYEECEGCIIKFGESKEAMIKELKQIMKDFVHESHLGFKYIPIQFLNRLIDKYEVSKK